MVAALGLVVEWRHDAEDSSVQCDRKTVLMGKECYRVINTNPVKRHGNMLADAVIEEDVHPVGTPQSPKYVAEVCVLETERRRITPPEGITWASSKVVSPFCVARFETLEALSLCPMFRGKVCPRSSRPSTVNRSVASTKKFK